MYSHNVGIFTKSVAERKKKAISGENQRLCGNDTKKVKSFIFILFPTVVAGVKEERIAKNDYFI